MTLQAIISPRAGFELEVARNFHGNWGVAEMIKVHQALHRREGTTPPAGRPIASLAVGLDQFQTDFNRTVLSVVDFLAHFFLTSITL